jgi:hypothetical protein
MRVLAFRAIELFIQNAVIVVGMGGQAMDNGRTSLSVVIALTVGAVYHFVALVVLVTSLA